jgi:hypothetical protein
MLPKPTTLLQQQEVAQQRRIQQHAQQLQLNHQRVQRQASIDELLAARANSHLQGPECNHALQDYQLQLMLLLQQNAVRLFNARAAQLRQLEMDYAREEELANHREVVKRRTSNL